MKYLPLVWRNLMRRKIRTIFTILSILIAFVLFGALMAIRSAFAMGVDVAGADRLMMIHKVSIIQLLPKSYADRIRATEGVTQVSHANWFGAYYQEPGNFLANMAVDPESWLRIYPEFQIPDDQKAAWLKNRMGAIVGIDSAKKYNWKVGDRVTLISPIYRKPDGSNWEFTIDGIYDSDVKGIDKTQFFFHWEYLNETFRDAGATYFEGQVGWYVFRVADPTTSDQLAKRIDAMFANSPAETKTATEKAFISDWAKQVGDIGAIMIAIAAIVMFFILFVTGNAMAQSIRERTNELGVLKTVGFGDGRILALVLLESCIVALVGGGIGLAIAWVIIAQGDPTGGMLPAFYFPVRDLIFGALLVLALGLGAGFVPAFQAGRLKIVDALRKTG
jgi:putative ABC transport system permease protein